MKVSIESNGLQKCLAQLNEIIIICNGKDTCRLVLRREGLAQCKYSSGVAYDDLQDVVQQGIKWMRRLGREVATITQRTYSFARYSTVYGMPPPSSPSSDMVLSRGSTAASMVSGASNLHLRILNPLRKTHYD